MRATTLKKKYPDEWARIADSMDNDIKIFNPDLPKTDRDRIAHDAAFLGCYEMDKRLKGQNEKSRHKKMV